MAGGEWESPTRQEVRTRTLNGSRGIGRGTLALAIAIPLLIGVVGGGLAGYMLQNAPSSGPTGGENVSFTLKAFITGFIGVGGDIEGKRNPTLEVHVNDRVTITLVDGEAMMHNVMVDGFNAATRDVMSVGDSASLTFVADKEGTFAYYCSIPGHRQSGMEGKLVVGTAGGADQPGPAKPVDVAYIAHKPTDFPGPVNRSTSATVNIYLEAREVVAEIEPGTTFTYWTFNGTVPGPFFRVRVNDTVVVHFSNSKNSTMIHSVDFHAVNGPGGGAVSTQTGPGNTSVFSFKALNPGLFVYHCASPHIPSHISMGMYGLILVEPEAGLPAVDHEFYVMQGDIYTKWPVHTPGHQEFDGTRLLDENPTYVVFNGRFQALTTTNYSMHANVNETVRIFFGVGGPNLVSAFHVIGEVFDKVYNLGDLLSPPLQSVQTVLVAPGGATIVDFTLQVPGRYLLVDHSLTRAIDKGALGYLYAEGPEDHTIYNGTTSGGGH